ncbi:PREDICTED: craniofacial development protein 2-like [Nicotiana attenuata]|uniref:craniofacial development protein 2-like n=1 Tax=Nicotiana attenuata TaxID=49451 RepID=UPI000905170B|nr:PREDICTED: craniofacial development protein 2-like [Nicotiana attenuata]
MSTPCTFGTSTNKTLAFGIVPMAIHEMGMDMIGPLPLGPRKGNSRSCWRKAGRTSTSKGEQPGRVSAKGGGKLDVSVEQHRVQQINHRFCSRELSVGKSVGQGPGGGTGGGGGRGGKGAYRLRIGSWNIGSLTSKSIELVNILQKRKINIACVQETRWVGSRAKDADGYKLWYSGVLRGKTGVGVLVDRHLRESVVEVRRVNDILMTIKLVVGECTLNVVSAYPPQARLDKEIKRRFWEGLDEIVRSILPTERLLIGGYFNGNIGSSAGGYTKVHGGFGFGERNEWGTSLLDFAKAFELVIANSSFPKLEEHLVTFQSLVAKTQIDYLFLKRCDRRLCEDCKVMPGETLTMQHRLLVMDIGIL